MHLPLYIHSYSYITKTSTCYAVVGCLDHALIEFLTRCVGNIPLVNVVDVAKSQFEKMPSIQDSKCCMTGKKLDLENIIAKIVGIVILGESIDDFELLEGWLGNTLEFVYAF